MYAAILNNKIYLLPEIVSLSDSLNDDDLPLDVTPTGEGGPLVKEVELDGSGGASSGDTKDHGVSTNHLSK